LPDVPATPPSSELDALGARLQAALGEGYAVEGRLGAGGFAVVFLVRDLNLKRKLAVKVLSPDVIASHSVLERFRREAETVAQLSHPHIVPLHFIGQKDDLVYLVMEAIDGGSLADRLQREQQLPIEAAARIFGEVASALAHAHKRGVVHRDIKPQNVRLDAESGRALVTDFGIARTAEGGSLTATGMVVGTPAYLSPEQVTGEPSDHRADIYALGVMMYEMLAGQPPFTGATPTAVLMKRLAGPPEPIRSLRKDVPVVLEDLVDACLQTDPNARLQHAADIARALTGASPVSGGHTTSTRARLAAPRKKRSNAVMLAFAGAIVVAAGFGAYLIATRAPATPTPSPTAAADSTMVPINGATYMIGSNDDDIARPAHPVQLAPFAIGRREVTVGEYQRFVATGRAAAPWTARPDSMLPVAGVRLAEAQSYCAWRYPNGGRLPTEEEWEAAARGIEGRRYPWGREWNPNAANVGARRSSSSPVGSYPEGRTPEGVDDLIGNVWEWTSSPFRPYGDAAAGSSGLFVIRGGGFNALPRFATAVFRTGYDPATDRENLAATGFRCAMSAPAPVR
jgi:formylglycine-generating enzyme required for sulfatase activity/tRNA A-37 threonylcarbamoyl transferase component Bud32